MPPPPAKRGSPDRSGPRTSRRKTPWRGRRRHRCRDRRRSRSCHPSVRGLSRASSHRSGVGLEPCGIHRLDLRRALGVPELPNVEVPLLPVDGADSLPAEQDVGRRLHHALPFDDALTVLAVRALSEERFEHRWLCLLELEEERIGLIAARQEQDPGAGAHAADPDDLTGGVDVSIALEQMPPVMRQRAPVRANHAPHDVLQVLLLRTGQDVLDRGDQGRIADDPKLAVDRSTELRERSQAVFRAHVGDARLDALHLLRGRSCPQLLADRRNIETRVPDLDVLHSCEAPHRLSVFAHRCSHDRSEGRTG